MKRQKTIKDIAKALNLSPSTVSRALRDYPKISIETRQRVKKLAEHWNYRPNEIALSLRNQRTRTIGVIVPEFVHFFFTTVISGIEEVAYSKGYTVMFCQSNESYEKEVLDTKALLDHRVDGLLISHARDTTNFDHLQNLVSSQIPVVFFDRVPNAVTASKVTIDDFEAAYKAANHLATQGCKRIAHLAGPQGLELSQNRKAGYLKALEDHGISMDELYVVECPTGETETGYEAMKKLLEVTPMPDGVCTTNDMVAVGAMKAIKEAGLNIPNDIAVVGFSNWQFASLVDPPLTSIAQPGIEMGKAAVTALIGQIEAPLKSRLIEQIVLETDLIVRASSRKKKF